ncbi:hypothetical protein [Sulfurovum sp.]|uniref:hypothetical protein n=1 Tax=Sulfurovum sp. TaxID=1969726 RepID=UPI0025FF8587|nr:hypothetical protein [Sulfurovum sp.]
MIKHTLFFLLVTLFFTGCAERSYYMHPTPVQKNVAKSTQPASTNAKEAQQATTKVIDVDTEESSVDDTTKNTIAGVLVFIIGIMVFI